MTKICPLLKKACVEHQCHFYIHLLGKNPQTDAAEDRWDCAVAFIPILLIENSQQQRQTGAAVESFRNEMVKANESSQQTLIRAVEVRQLS